MFENLREPHLSFLKAFFDGDKNCLSWDSIRTSESKKPELDLIRKLIGELEGRPEFVILPKYFRKRDPDWYVIAFSAKSFRSIRETLTAFIGYSYTNFRGYQVHLNTDDPFEKMIFDYAGDFVYKFRQDAPEFHDKIYEFINLMYRVLKKKPERGEYYYLTTARILHDFEMWLSQENMTEAEKCLEKLKRENRLSILNLQYLEIRLYAERQQWEKIMLCRNTLDIARSQRPLLVTQNIILALFHTQIAEFANVNNCAAAVDCFGKAIAPDYSQLFNVRGSIKAPEALIMFMLYLAAGEKEVHEAEVNKILSDFPEKIALREFLESIASLVKIKKSEAITLSPLEKSEQMLREKKYDLALETVLNCDPDLSALRIAINCVHEIKTIESINLLLDFYVAADQNTKNEVLTNTFLKKKWDAIRRLHSSEKDTAEVEKIKTWVEWLEKLCSEDNWSGAVKFAEKAKDEWDVNGYKNDREAIKKIKDYLYRDKTKQADRQLYDSIPYLIEFFKYRDESFGAFRSLYHGLIEIVILRDEVSSADIAAVLELAECILKIGGVNKNEYKELITNLSDIWRSVRSPQRFDWALDVLDALVYYHCPLQEERVSFLTEVVDGFTEYYTRVEQGQFKMLKILAREIKCAESVEALESQLNSNQPDKPASTEVVDKLKGKIIAIYTLTESAAGRAKEMLSKMYKGLDIRINYDFTTTDKLKSLAKNAYIFLFCSKSAKHSAFECIQNNRPKDAITVQVDGKGTSSLLRGFEKALLELE